MCTGSQAMPMGDGRMLVRAPSTNAGWLKRDSYTARWGEDGKAVYGAPAGAVVPQPQKQKQEKISTVLGGEFFGGGNYR